MMDIVKLHEDKVSEIKPLWEQLNLLHENLSHNFKQHFARFTFEERMKLIYQKNYCAVFVAKSGDKNVGYALVSVEKNVGEIDSIFVVAEYRRRGLGKKMIEKSHAWLAEHNVKKIIIGVAEGNESAFPFYQKLGYLPRLTILEKI